MRPDLVLRDLRTILSGGDATYYYKRLNNMKAVIAILLSLFALQAAAQPGNRHVVPLLFRRAGCRQRDSLYGFIDRNGVEVIPCPYQKAYNFNDGIAMVRHNFEVFAIDTLGNRLDRKVRIPNSGARSSRLRLLGLAPLPVHIERRIRTIAQPNGQRRHHHRQGRPHHGLRKADDSPESIF